MSECKIVSTPFAKIFNSSKYGQILVTAECNSFGFPIIAFAVSPNGNYMRQEIDFHYGNSGWKERDNVFESIDLCNAETAVSVKLWFLQKLSCAIKKVEHNSFLHCILFLSA